MSVAARVGQRRPEDLFRHLKSFSSFFRVVLELLLGRFRVAFNFKVLSRFLIVFEWFKLPFVGEPRDSEAIPKFVELFLLSANLLLI